MAVDWKKEASLTKRIFFWYMKVGLIAIPFGLIYGLATVRLGYESKPIMVVCLVAALLCALRILGMPPSE